MLTKSEGKAGLKFGSGLVLESGGKIMNLHVFIDSFLD